MIDGVIVTPLRQIVDERGKVMHMLRCDATPFRQFGEIYFSVVYPGAIKAWKLHKRMILNCAVPHGQVKFVLYDGRDGSPTKGEVQQFFLSPDNYMLVTVPPMIWSGFKGLGIEPAIVANCASIPHDHEEVERLNFSDSSIPYNWDTKRE